MLLYNERIVVPKALRKETLQKIHSGHQGVERCRARVAMSVWWPGVTSDVREMVQSCKECMCRTECEEKRAVDSNTSARLPVVGSGELICSR